MKNNNTNNTNNSNNNSNNNNNNKSNNYNNNNNEDDFIQAVLKCIKRNQILLETLFSEQKMRKYSTTLWLTTRISEKQLSRYL